MCLGARKIVIVRSPDLDLSVPVVRVDEGRDRTTLLIAESAISADTANAMVAAANAVQAFLQPRGVDSALAS